MKKDELTETQKDIQQAFITLWETIPADKIRVKGVCEATPIARSTFYTYYDSIEELKADIEERTIQDLVAINRKLFRRPIQQVTDILFVETTLAYVAAHHHIFHAFLVAQTNLAFTELWKRAIKEQFTLLFRDNGMRKDDFLLEIFAASVIAAISYQLKKPEMSLDSKDISQLIFKILS
ncbi:TetR/AcrR family transcriptional regulator [Streptococcus thoraltensis]|uniref:TetR/AcrR family transcriptional regulator n=1 Tax=Streptococcus thoraltensis TaxID=55085 RepID=UPI00037A912E|nr:TetR/AcrR family transcriptional regulator [Streptococcus thoraltensis]MDY4762083.1 TetR/AcrR family transcriptional regulator [Streptococcus thoraltensis]